MQSLLADVSRLTAVVAVYSSLFLLDQARLFGLEDWTLYRWCDTITKCVECCVENIGAMPDFFLSPRVEYRKDKNSAVHFPAHRLQHHTKKNNYLSLIPSSRVLRAGSCPVRLLCCDV